VTCTDLGGPEEPAEDEEGAETCDCFGGPELPAEDEETTGLEVGLG